MKHRWNYRIYLSTVVSLSLIGSCCVRGLSYTYFLCKTGSYADCNMLFSSLFENGCVLSETLHDIGKLPKTV